MEKHTYTGSCHCGAVAFEATMPTLTDAMSCNCSYCSRKGTLLTFIPRTDLTLLQGTKDLTEYRFNKKVITHLFCAICGVQAFGYGSGPDGTEMAAINVRCLDGVDLSQLTITEYNAKDS